MSRKTRRNSLATPQAGPSAVATRTVQAVETYRSGPIPSPQELLLYDQLHAGLAAQIVAMAEREQAHRIELEAMAVSADIRHRDEIAADQRETTRLVFRSDKLGQIIGGVIAALSVVGAIYLAMNDAHPAVSIALVGLPLAALVKSFRANGDKPKDDSKK